jgi:hypothetical protein
MAVVVIQELPEMTTIEMYDAVNERIGVAEDPPDGLIIHTGGADESGRLRVVDVWESAEAHDRFRADRLVPAIEAIARDAGMDPSQMPSPTTTMYEAHDLYEPAAAGAR